MITKIFVHSGHQFLVVNNERHLEITFACFGASVYSIKYRNKIITYHPDDKDVFLNSTKYFGKTLGRTCGRIKDGLIKIKDKTYQLDKNEKNNTLHGGFASLSFKDFKYEVTENANEIKVIFIYNSPDGECGYPGNVMFRVTYHISKKKDAFLIHYLAMPDAVTPINLSTHIYWRLDGDDILNHELYVHAEKQIKGDTNLVNTKDVVISKLMDFNKPKLIGKGILDIAKEEPNANGIDHGFIFTTIDRPQVTLKHAHIKLSVKTDMNMANIYTNNISNSCRIKYYGDDMVYGGIAIEPQMHFLSYEDIMCDKEHPYEHSIAFVLEDY